VSIEADKGRKRRLLRRTTAGLCAVPLVATMTITGAAPASAAPPQNDVQQVNDGSEVWAEQAYECTPTGAYLTPQQDNVAGPQRAPFGSGSHHIQINEYSTQTELYRTDAYDGTALSELSRLQYSTHASPLQEGAPDRQPTYMRLTVDNNGDGTADDSLFFIPANNGEQHPVQNGVWQSWNVASGDLSVNGDSGPDGTVTLEQYVQQHPTATLVNNGDGSATGGSIALITGCGQGGDTDSQRNGNYYVDRVIVGTNDNDTLFDFEGPSETNGGIDPQTVDPDNRGPWVSQAYDWQTGNTLTSNQTFVEGPGTAPEGRGSLRFTVSDDTNPNRVEQFRSTSLDGRLLRDVRDLSYSTYVQGMAGNDTPQQPPYLYLRVDNNRDGTPDDVLFFYPANNADQHPVTPGTWQTWNAGGGKWNLGGDDGPANAFTLEQYLAEHPNAKIINNSAPGSDWSGGGVTFQVGAGGAGQTNGHYFVDDITMTTADAESSSTVSGTAYDLEPGPAPTPAPQLSIDGTQVAEGDSGKSNATFTITMDKTTDRAVTVDYVTGDESATSPSDYDSTSGTATIPQGQRQTTVTVPVNGDTTVEQDETFSVSLSKPQNAAVDKGSATGTITNDDEATPGASNDVTVSNASVEEGNSGTSDATFTVSLEEPQDGPTEVTWATNDTTGTAEVGSDYQTRSGSVTVPANQTTATFTVPVNGDKTLEPDERLWVKLGTATGPGTPQITDGDGRGLVVNDDTEVTLKASNASGDRVRALVGTTPDAAGNPVNIYRKVGDENRLLWQGTLNSSGGLDRVLPQDFHQGNTVRLFARVATDSGNYWSNDSAVTID
jgi:Calx-beta domain